MNVNANPTLKPAGGPAQDRGAVGGGGTYQEPLLDPKATIRDALGFLHPGDERRDPGIDTATWPVMAPEAFYTAWRGISCTWWSHTPNRTRWPC